MSLILAIDQVLHHSHIILHAFELVYTLWISKNCAWFKKITILIIKLNAIQTDIVEITMGRVNVQLHNETDREAAQLIFLEEL